MQTKKQKDKEKNVKIQLINLVSTVNLVSFLIDSLHNVYKNYTLSLVRILCCSVLVSEDKGYFYRYDIYQMLPYSLKYFQRVFKEYENDDYFVIVYKDNKQIRYVLSDKASLLLESFYVSFIEQLNNSL